MAARQLARNCMTPMALVDSSGNLYIADLGNNRIRKVTPSGTITTVAGNGTQGYSGDGGPATSAELNTTYGVAVDGSGNLFIIDLQRIRKVTPGGTITTVAGNGTEGYSGDGGPATSAELYYPSGVAVDGSGNLFIGDRINQRIRKVTPGGTITTVAGNGIYGYSGDGGPAISAQLYAPSGVAFDTSGNLYIADYANERIRKVAGAASSAPLSITTASLPAGTVGIAYSVQLAATGGKTPYTWSATGLPLPGMNLSPSGLLSGTPTASGNYTLPVITVADSSSPEQKATVGLSITINSSTSPVASSYTLSSGATSVTIAAGSSSTVALNLASTNYAGTVALAVSVSSTEVSASAPSVTLTNGGSGSSTLTITTATSAANHSPQLPWKSGGAVMFCAVLLGAPFTLRRKRALAVLLMAAAIILTGFLMSCGGGSSSSTPPTTAAHTYTVTVTPTGSGTVTNPAPVSFTVTVSPSVGSSQPTITSLSPASAAAASSAMTITINGSGFIASSTVTYKGVAHAAAFVSASQLSMTLSASDLATAGSFPIVVTNPGGSPSNSVNFTVTSGGGTPVLPNKTFTFVGTMILQGKSLPYQIITYANGDGTYSLTLTAGTQGTGLFVTSQFDSGVTSSGANAVFSGPCTGIFMNQDTGAYTNLTSTNLTMQLTSFAEGSTATGTATFSPGSIQGTFTGTFTSISNY